MTAEAAVHRRWAASRQVDLASTLGPLRRGGSDPTMRWSAGRLWRTARTPDGPATQLIGVDRAACAVDSWSWGPGADWLAERVEVLLGSRDDTAGDFRPEHPLLRDALRRFPGWRVPRTELVFEALAPAVLEQKVTGQEARRSWRWLVGRFGEPAPGPAPPDMRVVPLPAVWATIPSWEWHRGGVGPERSRTLVGAAQRAAALERTLERARAEAEAGLRSLPGVGVWTSAEVRQRAHGDPDAVSVGDFHIAAMVVYALTGKRGGTDEEMLELLEPYEGHRHRVVRMIELTGIAPERRGPRYTGLDHRRR
jgi:3-methyladenine DNA glycosylase/8-oxoguanine DNA glycosylase